MREERVDKDHPMKCRVIFFDAGDTLVAKRPSDTDVLIMLLKNMNIQVPELEAKEAWKSAKLWAGEQALREAEGAPLMPDNEFFRNMYDAAIGSLCQSKSIPNPSDVLSEFHALPIPTQHWELLDEAVVMVLEYLTKAHYTLGVVSNWSPDLSQLLEELDIKRYFSTLVVSSIEGVVKPNPRILEIACRNLETPPNDCVYVGDFPHDILCAKRAGMRCIWLAHEDADLPQNIPPPDCRIASIHELFKIF